MATKLTLTRSEFFDARENEAVKDELFDVDDHGDSSYELVILRDGRFYRTTYNVLKEDGVFIWESHVTFEEVRPVTKTITVYEPVEEPPQRIAKPCDPTYVEELEADEDCE